jgi:ferredoxin
VDYSKCTGCGACEKACPRGIIRLEPFVQTVMMTVGCSSRENGKSTRAACSVGCIGCGLCAKQTPLFKVEENLAKMDYTTYVPSEACDTAMQKCPTGAIVMRGVGAPEPRVVKKSEAAA